MSLADELDPGAVVVVGGTGGIGRVVCESFARAGSEVAFTSHARSDLAEQLALRLRSLHRESVHTAVSVEDADVVATFVRRVRERFGTIHTVVYAAGSDIGQPYVSEVTLAEWRRVIEVDVIGFFSLVHAILPVFREQRHGTLVSVTTAATHRSPPRDVLSAAPKAAVESVTKAIAKEEGKFGIRANCVAPGMIDVGLGARILERHYAGGVAESILHDVPLRRFGAPEDIAEAVLFLASRRARYITGQTVVVDGGWLL